MAYYPLWFLTIDDILVLSTKPTSEDTIQTDDAFQTFATMHRGVIFDMSDVDYISSSMVGISIHLHKLLQPLRKRLKMVTSNPEIHDVMKITRTPVFQLLFSTVDEAVSSEW